MAKVDLGTKRVCPECDAKFYDLVRNPAICPMCQNSFDPSELDAKPIIPTGPLKPQKPAEGDEEEETVTAEVDEEDVDEEEEQAKELELDGDDVAVIGGAKGNDDDQPGYDGYSEDEDEDQDAALVADDDDNELPPPDADGTDDDDDVEEVEI